MKLSVLMTVYNEADFVEYAIRSCIDHVDSLIIVEGAYQETIDIGKPPRSDDGTNEIIHDLFSIPEPSTEFTLTRPKGANIHYIQANEKTDKDQRNVGLEIAKKIETDWLLIIDGDEAYHPQTFRQIKALCKQFDNAAVLGCYFRSLTFVNDFWHYTEQDFPRLFKVTPDCKFVDDNFMEWPGERDGGKWRWPQVTKMPQVKYWHYAFCKGQVRFLSKKNWWETRFKDRKFEYDWYIDENNQLYSPNHKVYQFTGKHPKIMKEHPMYNKNTPKEK